MNMGDYDGRTALHLASAEGHLRCVRFLLDVCKVHIETFMFIMEIYFVLMKQNAYVMHINITIFRLNMIAKIDGDKHH